MKSVNWVTKNICSKVASEASKLLTRWLFTQVVNYKNKSWNTGFLCGASTYCSFIKSECLVTWKACLLKCRPQCLALSNISLRFEWERSLVIYLLQNGAKVSWQFESTWPYVALNATLYLPCYFNRRIIKIVHAPRNYKVTFIYIWRVLKSKDTSDMSEVDFESCWHGRYFCNGKYQPTTTCAVPVLPFWGKSPPGNGFFSSKQGAQLGEL